MPRVVGKVIMTVLNDGKADVHIEGMDPLQVAQAFMVTAGSIISNFRRSRGAKPESVIITPNLGGFEG